MKRLIGFCLLLFCTLLTFGQSIPVPVDLRDLLSNLNTWVGTLLGVAGVVVFLTALANKYTKAKGFWKQFTAWLVAIVLMVLMKLLNFGLGADMDWIKLFAHAMAAGFMANGLYDIELVKIILRLFKLEKEAV